MCYYTTKGATSKMIGQHIQVYCTHAEHKKMFARWFDSDRLAFLAAFAETELAQIVCRLLLGLEMLRPGDSQKVYTSKNHDRDFPFGLYAKFVAEKIPVDLSRFDRIVHYQDNMDFFLNVAKDGFNVWDQANPNTKAARISILRQYGPLFSSNYKGRNEQIKTRTWHA